MKPPAHVTRHAATLCIAASIAMLAGCVQAPVRPASTEAANVAAVTRTADETAQSVQVLSPTGRLSIDQRERLFKRLGPDHNKPLKRLVAAMSTEPRVQLITGNSAQLLTDGPQTFEAMFDAIAKAQHSVLVESYIVDDAAIADQLAQLLTQQRQKGRQVALLYDAVGSLGTDPVFFDRLRAAGVAVCAFNPLIPDRDIKDKGRQSPLHRDHRKIVVVDRHTGFTGGINISSVYASGSFSGAQRTPRQPASQVSMDDGWRDTQVRLKGPAAAVLDDMIRSTWAQQECDPALDAPPEAVAPAAAGQQVVRIVPSRPDLPYSPIYTALNTAIDASIRSVHITAAYFAPGADMVDALKEAARRGVDVQLVLPSVTDFQPVYYAGCSYYDEMLEAGVRIHELQGSMLHAKTAVIDGVMSTVGSSNLDYRSFAGNNELNAVILDEGFGQSMEQMFAADVKASRQVTLAAWRQRPLWERIKEWSARSFESWW